MYLLTSMKSALAGMYPAMSRDITESKVGRGGSSQAGMAKKSTITHYIVCCAVICGNILVTVYVSY